MRTPRRLALSELAESDQADRGGEQGQESRVASVGTHGKETVTQLIHSTSTAGADRRPSPSLSLANAIHSLTNRHTHVPTGATASGVIVGVSVGDQFGAVSPGCSVVNLVVIFAPPIFVNRPSMYVCPACSQLRFPVVKAGDPLALSLGDLSQGSRLITEGGSEVPRQQSRNGKECTTKVGRVGHRDLNSMPSLSCGAAGSLRSLSALLWTEAARTI